MDAHTKTSSFVSNLIQFVKLQLAGNILFIGTMIGLLVADTLLAVDPFIGIVTGSALAHVVFFYVNKNWIFTDADDMAIRQEAVRFFLFMGFNFFLNLFLVESINHAIAQYLPTLTDYAYYIGLVGAGMFFAIWSYLGLKFWVFGATPVHAKASRHHGITYEKSVRTQP